MRWWSKKTAVSVIGFCLAGFLLSELPANQESTESRMTEKRLVETVQVLQKEVDRLRKEVDELLVPQRYTGEEIQHLQEMAATTIKYREHALSLFDRGLPGGVAGEAQSRNGLCMVLADLYEAQGKWNACLQVHEAVVANAVDGLDQGWVNYQMGSNSIGPLLEAERRVIDARLELSRFKRKMAARGIDPQKAAAGEECMPIPIPKRPQRQKQWGLEGILAAEDFNDDRKDAGEIGVGHAVTALYEAIPAGGEVASPSVDPLKYQSAARPSEDASVRQEMLTLKLRYKAPDADESKPLEFAVTDTAAPITQASADFHLSAAVALFGMLLRDSEYKGSTTYDTVLELAAAAKGSAVHAYRAEFLEMVRRAKALSGK